MQWRVLLLLVSLLLGGCNAGPARISGDGEIADSVPSFPTGIFGNVCQSQLTGDAGGFEIRFFEDAGQPMAEFTLCEGWCNESFVSPVSHRDGAFHVSHIEELIGAEVSRLDVAYRLTPSGEGLRLKMWYDGEELPDWGEGPVLFPLRQSSGLALVNSSEPVAIAACDVPAN